MGFADHPQKVWWRKALFQVHLWIGVFLGLYVIAISLSGSLLVFEQQLLDDTPQLAGATAAGRLKWGQVAAAAMHAYPGALLDNIDMRTANRRVASVGLKQNARDRIVYVDLSSGRVIGSEMLQARHPIVELAERLHNELAAGLIGARANGIGGALLFLMSVTGIVVWWPGRRHWKRALKVKWNARWARLNWDLHSAFGFWSCIFVAMWGISGAYFIFPKPFTRVITLVSPMHHLEETPSAWRPGEPVLPIDTLIARAEQLYPRDQLAYLYLDTHRPQGVVKVFLSGDPTLPLSLLEDVVSFEPSTGRILSNISSAQWTAGERLSLGIYAVHFGNFAGLPGEIAWSLLGLVPALLAASGYVMWWNRVLRKKWVALRGAARDRGISQPA